MQTVREELRSKIEQLQQLAAESTSHTQELETIQAAAARATRAEEEKAKLEISITRLEDQLSVLSETEAALEKARKELRTKSFTDEEVDAIKSRCAQLVEEVARLQQGVKDLEAEEFVARQGKDAACGKVLQLESSIKALEEQLVHDEEGYDKIITELKERNA